MNTVAACSRSSFACFGARDFVSFCGLSPPAGCRRVTSCSCIGESEVGRRFRSGLRLRFYQLRSRSTMWQKGAPASMDLEAVGVFYEGSLGLPGRTISELTVVALEAA